MPRFFLDSASSCGETLLICGDDANHISRSLRMRVGEKLTVCDGDGLDCLCEIVSICEGSVELRVLQREESKSEPKVRVTLYQGYPKSDKLETIIEKSVELGVCEITPVLTERSVARPDDKAAQKKLVRWQRRALEAAKQCGRGIIPQVNELLPFEKLPELAKKHELFICFYELGGEPLRSLLECGAKDIAIFIGPEGGISKEELLKLQNSGAKVATLGERILRTETAPIAALAAIMFASGELG